MECLGENTVADLLAAQLSPERRAGIEAHTATCDDCRRLISELVRRSQTRSLAHASTVGGVGTPPKSIAEPRRVPPGTLVGRYLVREQIGSGAMGAVFAAYDPELDRPIALKLLHPGSAAQRDRIYREARAIGRLAHPNVVAAFDVGAHGDDLFIAMELIAGVSLRAWTARAHTMTEILDVFGQAARGLAAAHAGGLVHRDFKPENVLVGSDGRVRIVDFGLAAGPDGSTELCGTPAYMAPEQLEVGGADPASDQFAFCIALYEALFGERPFAVNVVAEVTRGLPKRSAARPVTPAVLAVLARGLAVDPGARFASMTALVDALAATAPRRSRAIYTAIGVAGMSAAVAAGVAGLVATRAPASAPPPVTVERCAGADHAFAAVWRPERGATLHRQLAAAGPDGAAAWQAVDRAVGELGDRWIPARTAACGAGDRRQLACLDRSLAELDQLLGGLDTPAHVPAVLARLPSARACAERDAVIAVAPAIDAGVIAIVPPDAAPRRARSPHPAVAVVAPPLISPVQPGQQGWPAVYQVNGKPAAHRPDPGHAGVVAATVRELGYSGLDRAALASSPTALTASLTAAASADDPDAAFAAVQLGMVDRARGDCAAAAPLWQGAIATLRRRTDDPARLWSARANFGLGLCALTEKQFADAKDPIARAWVYGQVRDEVTVALAVLAYEVGDQLQSYGHFTVVRRIGGPIAQRALQTWLDQTGLGIGP